MNLQPPFLDLSQAKAIATEAAQLRALVETFDTSLGECLTELEQAFATGNAEQAHFHLHTLKGFIALFSQAPLAQAITELYQVGRKQPLAEMGATYRALAPSLRALQAEVKGWRGD